MLPSATEMRPRGKRRAVDRSGLPARKRNKRKEAAPSDERQASGRVGSEGMIVPPETMNVQGREFRAVEDVSRAARSSEAPNVLSTSRVVQAGGERTVTDEGWKERYLSGNRSSGPRSEGQRSEGLQERRVDRGYVGAQIPEEEEIVPVLPTGGEKEGDALGEMARDEMKKTVAHVVQECKRIVEKGVKDFRGEMKELERNIFARLTDLQAVTDASSRILATISKVSEEKARVNYLLAGFNDVFERGFYMVLYGVHFVQEMVAVMRKVPGLNEKLEGRCDMEDLSEAMRKAFHGIIYRRRSHEVNYLEMSKGEAHKYISEYRRRLSRLLITVAEKNKSVGIKRVPVGGVEDVRYAEIQRPFWLSANYIQKGVIDDVHYKGESFEDDSRVASTRKRAFESGRGIVTDAMNEKEMISREIVRRLSQKGVNQLNKSRDALRKEFFVCLGFVWQSSAGVEISGNVFTESLGFNISDVLEMLNVSSLVHAQRIEAGKKNRSIFEEFMRENGGCFQMIAKYEVDVGEKGSSRREKNYITRGINLIQVALMICMRFNMCAQAMDFLSLHVSSLRVVVSIAIMLKAMVRERNLISMEEVVDYELPSGDFSLSKGSEDRNMRSLLFDLVPPTYSVRQSLLQKQVKWMTCREYNALNLNVSTVTTQGREGSGVENLSVDVNEDEDDRVDDEGMQDLYLTSFN